MLSPWGESFDKNCILPEHPTPQFERQSWMSLNGRWDYEVSDLPTFPFDFTESINVPFAPETALSGIGSAPVKRCLWYRVSRDLPEEFKRGRVLLHFGAVSEKCTVWVNGHELANHEGGNSAFVVDISEALAAEIMTIVVLVEAMSKNPAHPLGIWQSVWLESVPENYIRAIRIVPNFDESTVDLWVAGEGECAVLIEDDWYSFEAGDPVTLPVKELIAWSPENPHLYPLRIVLGEDVVDSYFAMRKISIGRDSTGSYRLYLNNEPYFHNGAVDHGNWPDGGHTAPADEAMVFDIENAKSMGFNTIRKMGKLEPPRWYYHCDRIGMMVWQDVPQYSSKEYTPETYLRTVRRMVNALHNVPSVVMWSNFTKPRFREPDAGALILSMDPDRLQDRPELGVIPQRAKNDKFYLGTSGLGCVTVLEEVEGYAFRLEGHYSGKAKIGFRNVDSINSLRFNLHELYTNRIIPAYEAGLSAAVFCQLTDSATSLNGLMPYDRRTFKLSPKLLRIFIGVENRK